MQAEEPVVGYSAQVHAGLDDDGAGVDVRRGRGVQRGVVRLNSHRCIGHTLLVDLYSPGSKEWRYDGSAKGM